MTEWGIETGLAVAGLILLVLLTRRAVARQFGPRAAYALWALPVLRLVWPATAIPESWVPKVLRPDTPIDTDAPVQVIDQTPAPFDALPVVEATKDAGFMETLMAGLPYIWLAGVLLGTTFFLVRQLRYSAHLKATTVELDPALRIEADRAARIAGLKSTPQICVSLVDDGPSVTGLTRPTIVLPSDFSGRFTPEQRRLALIHEMSHIKRGDLWSATAMLAFRLLNWPNPLVHLAWPAFRADQEAACDATVLRRVGETERASYAETLLTAATHSGRASPVTGAGLSLSLHHPVKERLMTLGTTTKRHGLARAGLATLLLTGAALTAPLSLADDPEKADEDKALAVFVEKFETRDMSELDGVSQERTYVFTNRDGSSGTMTREEFIEQYGDKLPEGLGLDALREDLAGEPGLDALRKKAKAGSRFVSISRFTDSEDGSYEIRKENGVTTAFRIEADGTRTEVDPSEVEDLKPLEGLDGLDALDAPGTIRLKRFPELHLKSETFFDSVMGDADTDAKVRFFNLSDGDLPEGFAFDTSAASRLQLRSAETMIESLARQIEHLQDIEEGRPDRDLREAERELKKARKALENVQSAMERRAAD